MKKGAPKYQNKVAFKMRFHDHYTEKIQNASLDRLCELCQAQIEWKIKYGKYKTPHDLSRCYKCEKKNIFKAYRRLCDACSDELKQCSKCTEPIEINDDSSSGEEMDETLKCLRERSKRTVLRKIEKGEITWDRHNKKFIDSESGEQVIVQYKKDYIDEEDEQLWEDNDNDDNEDDEDDNSDESEEEDNTKKNKKKVQIQQQQKVQQKKIEQSKKQKAKKVESSDDDGSNSDESDEENQFNQIQQINQKDPSVYSDGSNEQEKIIRREKNFRFYFDEQYQLIQDE
ncbi:unnamed protein product (macronuclear) [Paramecium tetraurelia]|uniref:Stc1 domain-containing protein n=1 Tax=Paramecium tetraurelia TaxID=5888 RepID=A0CWB6_PARTE|nr:uncharacterized protein GSPATT00001285001 [Paramecium tetraurelia]CAK75083.1 unnamed protein product [Paramecium tetraurelia]|eukprot:XP_001442480.1 hypothetical protein (macronuclear) [Paramecium tetraurelia strain d4-2]